MISAGALQVKRSGAWMVDDKTASKWSVLMALSGRNHVLLWLQCGLVFLSFG